MAQQASNPQREPSMDEILASIRRIIEESEPERVTADLSAIERLTGEPSAARTAANDPARAAPVQPPVAPALDASAAELDMEMELRSGSFDVDSLALDPDLESVFSDLDASHRAANVELAPAVEPETQSVVEQPVLASVLAEAMAADISENPRSIMSESTGRQVAASFGDLADAFAANRRRSFDEVAEEMMRPMLQEWMDNNLPTLVERLVREEIERVARGG